MDAAETLQRVRAGLYRTEDERFSVEQSVGRWYVRDAERKDQFGQPVLSGPHRTLDEARSAIAVLRAEG